MACNSELMGSFFDRFDRERYRECRVCGEARADVNRYSMMCYDCAEAAEEAAALAEDAEPECTCVRTGDREDATGCEAHGAARRKPAGRQQGELNFVREVA
jgi:hypothetical protein